ncbi:MAG: 50S ribosome-binding protein YggL [Vicinamibacterales bacterium]
MKRRLRKKKRLGEFQELGFEVSYRVRSDVSEEDRETLIWNFLQEGIEGNDLRAGGGGGESPEFFVVSARRRGSVTDAQRRAVGDWLSKTSRITAFNVGPLRDAWYGWES